MTDTADAAPPEQRGGMRVPRSRGVVSGVLLVLAGVWAAFVPFVGPAFHFAYTPKPHETWHWTAARGWYEVLPGSLTILGGLLLIFSANRIVTSFGAWIAALAGAWLVVGQQVRYLLTLGSTGAPSAAGDRRYVAEYLAFFTGIGALIIFVAAVAVGRLSVRSVRDQRAAARREQAAVLEQEAVERDDYRDDYAGEQYRPDDYRPDYAPPSGYGTPGTTEAMPVERGPAASAPTSELPAVAYRDEHAASPDDDTTAMPVVAQHDTPEPRETDHDDNTVAMPVAAPEPTDSVPPSRREAQAPRRYFGPGNHGASGDEPADEQPESPARDAVRTDEGIDQELDHELDLGEPPR